MRVSANFYYLLTSSTVCLNPVSAWVGGGRIFERMQRGNVHMSTLVEKEVATIKDVKVMTKLTKNIKQADVGAAVPPYHRLLTCLGRRPATAGMVPHRRHRHLRR